MRGIRLVDVWLICAIATLVLYFLGLFLARRRHTPTLFEVISVAGLCLIGWPWVLFKLVAERDRL